VRAADTSRASTIIRAARPDDVPFVRALVDSSLAGSAYHEGATAAVDSALFRPSAEARALVALLDDRHAGVTVYGAVAGAVSAGRIQVIVVDAAARGHGVARSLVQAALTVLADAGMRVVFIELPGDPALAATRSLLLASGFRIDATVADYYRDGVDLVILRHDLTAS
jgi:ribosomal protein S18 acetylase RimI-like enzyme